MRADVRKDFVSFQANLSRPATLKISPATSIIVEVDILSTKDKASVTTLPPTFEGLGQSDDRWGAESA